MRDSGKNFFKGAKVGSPGDLLTIRHAEYKITKAQVIKKKGAYFIQQGRGVFVDKGCGYLGGFFPVCRFRTGE